MSVIKITPKNLPGIHKHFSKLKKETEQKLRAINKKRIQLERELEMYKDGEEWCAEVYDKSKGIK